MSKITCMTCGESKVTQQQETSKLWYCCKCQTSTLHFICPNDQSAESKPWSIKTSTELYNSRKPIKASACFGMKRYILESISENWVLVELTHPRINLVLGENDLEPLRDAIDAYLEARKQAQ